jgi:spectinomycin phosphotransferase
VRAHEVRDLVAHQWDDGVDRVAHLPVGFGAHHWAAYAGDRPRLFVTLDGLEPRRSADGLEAAYVSAGELQASGLDFVLPPVPDRTGACTVLFADGALSCTPWRDGVSGGDLDLEWTQAILGRLHAAAPPPALPHWGPLVGPGFPHELATLVTRPWGPGPFADEARSGVRDHLEDVARFTRRYHELAAAAQGRRWVPTHGEPHSDNQLLTDRGRVLIDWESLRLAPAERDLRTLVGAGVGLDRLRADPEMLELFDLEWRLDEISEYAAWFAAPHTGTRDDEIAIDGLHHELTRPERPTW